MPFIETVELIVGYHALILGLLLILLKGPRSLGLFCIIFAAHMMANIGTNMGLIPLSADITSAFGLAYGPLMYLFVRELSFEEAKLNLWPDLLHLTPALLVMLIRPQDPTPQIIGFPLIIAYCVFIFMRLREHREIAQQIRADAESISLRWVSTVFFVFVAIALFDFARVAAPKNWPIEDDQALAVTLFAVIILLSVMAWKSVVHGRRKGPHTVDARSTVQTADTTPDQDAAAKQAFEKIDAIFQRDQLWREPRLTLDNVAEVTAHTPREVSRAINLVNGTSFSTYVNGLRVAHVDRLMADETARDRTLLDLSFEAGFNSKSAFNRHYRALRGEPPSQALERKRASFQPKTAE